MNYKEKFEDFLNRMTGLLDEANKKGHIIVRVEDLENAFPELKESEDEKIRKELLDYCKNRAEKYPNDPKYKNIGAWIAWLEKQGEQKHADKVKPKFHEGEWVVYECGGETATLQITRIVEETYVFSDDSTLEVVDEDTLRLWDITKDAKKGDVLRHNGCTFIFICIEKGVVKALEENLCNGTKACNFGEPNKDNDYSPATKEQRDAFFANMKEAGYEWDAEKKILKEIENEIEIPFGAKDSELQEATYYIPKFYHAEIDDDKVVIKKGEKPAEWSEEDERMYRGLHNLIYSTPCCDSRKEFSDWLNSIRPRIIGLK